MFNEHAITRVFNNIHEELNQTAPLDAESVALIKDLYKELDLFHYKMNDDYRGLAIDKFENRYAPRCGPIINLLRRSLPGRAPALGHRSWARSRGWNTVFDANDFRLIYVDGTAKYTYAEKRELKVDPNYPTTYIRKAMQDYDWDHRARNDTYSPGLKNIENLFTELINKLK